MMTPEETKPMVAPEEGAPMAEESKFDIEGMVGNMLDLPDNERKIASRVILGPMANVLDKIIGEPVFSRMNLALGEANKTAPAAPAPAEEGMMTPPAPETEAPMPEEEMK